MKYDCPCLIFEQNNSEMSLFPQTTVLFLHGGDSNQESLRPLASYFKNQRLMLPQAPIQSGDSMFNWFHFTDDNLSIEEQSLEASIDAITPLLTDIRNANKDGRFIVGGISQGAIFAYELFFRFPTYFEALVALSGFAPQKRDYPSLNRKRAFIAHGIGDPLIPMERALGSVELLRELHVDVQFKKYIMGHEIMEEELQDAMQWMEQ